MYDELIKSLRNCSEINSLSRYKRDLMKQAANAIEELQKDLERSKDFEAFWQHEAEETLKKFQVAISNKPRWIPVTERLPENDVPVLLSCKCGAGAYICDGFHTEKYSTPIPFYADIDADYNEEADEYYFPEGWWEIIKNWDDYSCVAIEDTITHWMPLPEPPEEE